MVMIRSDAERIEDAMIGWHIKNARPFNPGDMIALAEYLVSRGLEFTREVKK
jgi:hypothetical protein